MNVKETKHLLRRFRIVPNKLLGQNFMVEYSVFPLLSEYASVDKADVVLDVGAGFGFLTRFLSGKCRNLLAVEKDPNVVKVLREQLSGLANVTIVEGDVLKVALPEFNKVVAIPPYYLSSRLVVWLLEKKVDCAVLVLQREFANRLAAGVGSEDYGWLSVVAFCNAEVELFDTVPKEMFYPQPEIDSVIVRLVPRRQAPFEVKNEAFFRRMVRWLFTQRNKKVGNALVPFIGGAFVVSKGEAEKRVCALPFGERRVRELSPKDFGVLANALKD